MPLSSAGGMSAIFGTPSKVTFQGLGVTTSGYEFGGHKPLIILNTQDGRICY